jgi:MYXO-CTERM domain-containing protein
VRVEGVVLTDGTAFSELNANFFIADPNTLDAIRVFDDVPNLTDVQPGDVVRVTGKIGVFRGVRQIGRDERRGQTEFRGFEITIEQLGTDTVPEQTASIATLLSQGEEYESQLVTVPNIQMVVGPMGEPIPATFAAESTVYIGDGNMTLPVRIFANTDLVGMAPRTDTFSMRGIFSQFAPGGTGGYQLQPRSIADVLDEMPTTDGGVVDSGTGDRDGGVDPNRDAGAGTDRDAGTGVNPRDSGVTGGGGDADPDSCGCRATHGPGASSLAYLVLLGLLLRRRRPVR